MSFGSAKKSENASSKSTYSKDIYIENWGKFGNKLKEYIISHKEELEEKSYDVILGFSRGGTILAFAFSCLLKDILPEYATLSKASVRPIPRGITYKKNKPCFVMDHPASDLENEDVIKNLQIDLKKFSQQFNNGKPISILIMDDNLTGATRVRFLEEKLKKMKCVGKCKKLAYVRHPAFQAFQSIDTITAFPKRKVVFVMPWHRPHEKKDLKLKKEKFGSFKLKFYMELATSYKSFKVDVRRHYAIVEDFVINGASQFELGHLNIKNKELIELNYFINMYYPPKKCLAPLNSDQADFGTNIENDETDFHSLCSYGIERTMGVCLACSCLNCNKDVIRGVSKAAKSETISFKLEYEGDNNKELDQGIKKWLIESIPEIRLMNYE